MCKKKKESGFRNQESGLGKVRGVRGEDSGGVRTQEG
jgi:hypothetical protein